jgi:hypothetical protein
MPLEDQRRIARQGKAATEADYLRFKDFRELQSPHGLQLGRTQRLRLYVNRQQRPWKVRAFTGD